MFSVALNKYHFSSHLFSNFGAFLTIANENFLINSFGRAMKVNLCKIPIVEHLHYFIYITTR